MRDEKTPGVPVDEFVKKSQQEHITRLVTQAVADANDMIRHARENFGATVEVDHTTNMLVAKVTFPEKGA